MHCKTILDNYLFLAQSDTTVGLLSKDSGAVFRAKKRDKAKKLIIEVCSFNELKKHVRVYEKHKRFIRRSKKNTFIYKDQAFRVVKDEAHLKFLKRFNFMYSSSANISGEDFDFVKMYDVVDAIYEDNRGLKQQTPSRIYRVFKNRLVRYR